MDAQDVIAQSTARMGRTHVRARAIEVAGYLGIASGCVYVLTTAAGSVLDPTYSQIRQHVSDLTATGASTFAARRRSISSTTFSLPGSPSSSIAAPTGAGCGRSEHSSSSSTPSPAS